MKLHISEDLEIIITLVWSTCIAYMYTMITAYPIDTYECVSTWKLFETGSLDLPQLTWNSLCRGQAGFRLAVMWIYPSIKKKNLQMHWGTLTSCTCARAPVCRCMWVYVSLCVHSGVNAGIHLCAACAWRGQSVVSHKLPVLIFFFKGIVFRWS